MDFITLICFFALIAGFYATWNIGANDVSNAMGTSVGSKSLTLKQAIMIAACFEFLGAYFFGDHVSETLKSGLVNTSLLEAQSGEYPIIFGMLSSLLATGMWLHFASYWGLPVSTTHSIVGAIIGFGLIAGGTELIKWDNVIQIASSWLVSPILGGFTSYLIFTVIKKTILSRPAPLKAAQKILPSVFAVFCSITAIICASSIEFKNPFWAISVLLFTIFGCTYLLFYWIESFFKSTISDVETNYNALMERFVFLQARKAELLLALETEEIIAEKNALDKEIEEISASLSPSHVAHYEQKQFQHLEKLFAILQVSTAALMAFSHGANDVANGIGPLEAILSALANKNNTLAIIFKPHVLLLGGIGIIIGLATWGWRVIETIGKNITELTPSRGFSAEFGASITILLASKMGLPISTTHTLVGSVIGIGLAGGISSLNIKTLKDIVASWVITIPGGAILSILWYQIFQLVIPFIP